MVNIIELVGNSDQKGNPIGHPMKVVNLFKDLLKEHKCVTIVPSNYLGYMEADRYVAFNKLSMGRSLICKVINVLYKLFNYYKIINEYRGNLLFINTDIYLLLAMSLIRKKPGSRVFAVVYIDYLKGNSSIKKLIIQRAYKVIDFVITNEYAGCSIEEGKKIIFPDYFYVRDYFSMHKKSIRYDFLVLGIIAESKHIEDVLEAVYHKHGLYTVKIAGHFTDENRYKVLAEKYKNCEFISIENKYLSEDEYKNLFAESKYLVLPYIGENYSDRGSGVFYDSLYFKTPVIATDIGLFKVLKEKNLGIVYRNSFSEALGLLLDQTSYEAVLSNIQGYCEEHSVEKYRKILEGYLI